MKQTATRAPARDVRLDLYRDQHGKWRWRTLRQGRTTADSGQGYRRRIDCLHGAMGVLGVQEITWFRDEWGIMYGQSSLGRMTVEVFVWKRWKRVVR